VLTGLARYDGLPDSGWPYSIVRATPFDEFAVGLADSATDGDKVRLPAGHLGPAGVGRARAGVAHYVTPRRSGGGSESGSSSRPG